MNFNQAPITRIINTRPIDTTTYAGPATPGAAGGFGTPPSLLSGRAVTVFFETPNWPLAASKISLKLVNLGVGSPTGLYACPNVYMTDADSKLFIRGNSLYSNANSPTNGIHVVYSAVLRNLVNTGVRSLESLVRPGDVITLTAPTASLLSNQITVSSITAIVTAVRLQGQNTVIEFSIGIDPDAIANTGISGFALKEVLFYDTAGDPPTNLVGLSRDQLSLKASSAAAGWSGDLGQAVNLSYPSANKVGIVPEPNASLYTLANKAWVVKCGAPFAGDYTFNTDTDQNSGSTGYKCISIVDSTTDNDAAGYQVEVTIYPAY